MAHFPQRLARAALAAVAGLSALAPPGAQAAARWTFCVASALDAKDVWISGIFPPAVDRDQLEDAMKRYARLRGAVRVVAQCPEPVGDPASAVNAQIEAESFNKRLGAALHAVSTQDFPPR